MRVLKLAVTLSVFFLIASFFSVLTVKLLEVEERWLVEKFGP
jgi:hypothetical protein